MSKKNFFRTCLITMVFALMMGISVMASTRGASISLKTSWSYIDVSATDSTMIHQMVVPRDGMVYLSGEEVGSYNSSKGKYNTYSLYFSLLNSSYSAINRNGSSTTRVYGMNENDSNYVVAYALKKGTYYIRVAETDYYRFEFKFKAVNDVGKTIKKKGTVINKGTTLTALFGANETYTKAEWFKIKLKKSKKIKLTFNAYGDAAYRITVYGPKPFKKGRTLKTLYGGHGSWYTLYVQKGRSKKKYNLKKGTYYVRIERTNYNLSGYCTVNWKYSK